MTRGFYDQVGVAGDADLDEIKAAYGRSVAHLLRRREATVAQGGDTSALDLARRQLDEAWEVLSDPARRRRYDAMLAVAGDGLTASDLDDLWTRVAGAMIHPAVAAAARIVDATTTLSLSPLPEPPRPVAGRGSSARHAGNAVTGATVDDEAITTPGRVTTSFGAPRPVPRVAAVPAASDVSTPGADVVPLRAGGPPLRVVRAREAPGDVVELPTMPTSAGQATSAGTSPAASVPTPRPTASVSVAPPTTPSGDVDQLVDTLGYSGALLRTMRERLGISIQTMSEQTRISARYLEAVEREDFAALPPAPAFVRGYVREMSRMLGLDVDRVVTGYMRRFDAEG